MCVSIYPAKSTAFLVFHQQVRIETTAGHETAETDSNERSVEVLCRYSTIFFQLIICL